MSEKEIMDMIDDKPIQNDFFDRLEEEEREAEKVADELLEEWGLNL